MYDYIHDGQEIYHQSFSIIQREADLSAIPEDLHAVIIRMIHACGMTDLPQDFRFSDQAGEAGRFALQGGAPILCDSKMVAEGITRHRLPASNAVICTLADEQVPGLAKEIGNTRSAAALELWRPKMLDAVVVIGNAPTALFYLLEMLAQGAPKPALIIGLPVGFVGAAESKEALMNNEFGVPFLTLLGRRGGSAMAAAAVNALGHEPDPRLDFTRK